MTLPLWLSWILDNFRTPALSIDPSRVILEIVQERRQALVVERDRRWHKCAERVRLWMTEGAAARQTLRPWFDPPSLRRRRRRKALVVQFRKKATG